MSRSNQLAGLLTADPPSALDTINEINTALGNDASLSTTLTNSIATKAPLASPTFTGDAVFDTDTLKVDATNNRVGIRTTNPDVTLDIHDANPAIDLYDTGTNGYCRIDANGANLVLHADKGANSNSSTIKFGIDNSVKMTIDSDGKLGIGDNTPDHKLTVQGAMQLRGGAYTDFTDFWGSGDNASFFLPYGFLGSNGSYNLSLYCNGYRNSSGGFTSMGINGNSTATGIGLDPDGVIHFRTGTPSGTDIPERMTIDSSGNVGIGTDSPSQLLDVYSSTSGTVARITGPNAYDAERGLQFSVGRAKISGFLNTTGGTPGSSLRFYTMPDGGSVTERMRIDSSGHITPGADNTQDFGSSSKLWQNIYTGDLHLSNEGSVNDVDGTSGDWTIQEGSEDLFLINNKSGKQYKFKIEEV